ncbi:alpha/beta fold hydrolase [Actinophytocola sediminis]
MPSTVELHRRTTGAPGNGPPVVLLHGLGGDATTWTDLTRALPDRHTIALDLRGHGQSPRSDTYTVDLMVADVLLALPEVSEMDLVGHSLGGLVASLLAGRHPELVRRLVLEDPPVPPETGPPLPDPNPPAEPTIPPPFDWRAVTPIRADGRRANPQWWANIGRIPAPTLWISGGPTSHLDPARHTLAAARMPAATVETIPVGHEIHATAPQPFADLVVPFLTR